MLKLILCILAAVVVVYLVVVFYKSDSEFIPLEDMTKKLMSAFLVMFATALLLGCHKGSNVQRDLSSMSGAEKLTLLEDKYQKWNYEGDFILGDSIRQIIAETEAKLYCYDDRHFVLCYSIDDDSWELMLPPDSINLYPMLGMNGCEDFLLKDNRLYQLFPTSACGNNPDYQVFYYDIKKEVWKYVPEDEDVVYINDYGCLCLKHD